MVFVIDDDIGVNVDLRYFVLEEVQNLVSIDVFFGSLRLKIVLDREQYSQILFYVYVIDLGDVFFIGIVIVNIIVKDVNDNVFMYLDKIFIFVVIENIVVFRVIGIVLVFDKDEGINLEVWYYLMILNIGELFFFEVKENGIVFVM